MTRRLLAGYLVLTIVVLTVLMVPLGIFYSQREWDRFTTDVERDASVIGTIYEDALELGIEPDPAAADKYRKLTGARVVVVERQGISILDTDDEPDRDFSTRPEVAQALAGQRVDGTRYSATLHSTLLYVAVPIASGGVVHGAVRVTLKVERIEQRIRQFWMGLAGVAGVVLSVATLTGFLLARSFTRPIQLLNETASRFSSGDLSSPSVKPSGPKELQELAATMTTMAERLDSLISEQRSFVGDASHQLRTPLTALRLRLENLQTRLNAPESDEVQSIIDESDRLATVVSDLLQLARAEQHSSPAEVDVSTVVKERVDTWSAVAGDHNVRISLAVPTVPIRSLAVPGAVEQIVDNLIDNAIKAAPDASTVEVQVDQDDGHCIIKVADHGSGLSDPAKALAVRRFWREDNTRPGTGLGLAIVAALTEASGGFLKLQDTVDLDLTEDPDANALRGLTVIVSLPLFVQAPGAPSPKPAES